MDKIKYEDEFFLSFAFNPFKYFDNDSFNYQNYDLCEAVFYIDSSNRNPMIEKVYNEIYEKL